MKITSNDGLLFVEMTLEFRGQRSRVQRLALHTGASQSVISLDAVEELGIYGGRGDDIVILQGIGGIERALRKKIGAVELGTFKKHDMLMDFALFDRRLKINGLVGLDILSAGQFVIDLHAMELYQRTSL